VDIKDEWLKLQNAKRIVVKAGTCTLTHQTGNLNLSNMEQLVRQLADIKNRGCEVLLVTSAAVGAGMGRLNIKERPVKISDRQALAAVGQGILMHIYEKLFSEYGIVAAQVLLTKDDFADRQRYLNARTTMRRILEYGAVPIINENDTVTFDQIKFGDNDTLSAMVAGLVDADLLVLLSDIDGLYTDDPNKNKQAELIPVVKEITPETESLAGEAISLFGSGGMKTKIAAANIAVSRGIAMVLTDGSRNDSLKFLDRNENKHENTGYPVGTLFLPKHNSMGSRKGWLAFGTRPAGTVIIDEGASEAICKKGKSLLPGGVLKIEKSFQRGEVVDIRFGTDTIARGIINFGSDDAEQIIGKHSREIDNILGPGYDKEIIHADNISLLK